MGWSGSRTAFVIALSDAPWDWIERFSWIAAMIALLPVVVATALHKRSPTVPAVPSAAGAIDEVPWQSRRIGRPGPGRRASGHPPKLRRTDPAGYPSGGVNAHAMAASSSALTLTSSPSESRRTRAGT